MDIDDAAARARQREVVRRGYDAISLAYRSDDGTAAPTSAEDVSRCARWVSELAGLPRPGARVLDLGCGAGIPATRELTEYGLQVIGVDFSAVQLRRARQLVPAAPLLQADMTALHLVPASLDGVVSFYALIHLPQADQRALFPRLRSWLRPGGYRRPGAPRKCRESVLSISVSPDICGNCRGIGSRDGSMVDPGGPGSSPHPSTRPWPAPVSRP